MKYGGHKHTGIQMSNYWHMNDRSCQTWQELSNMTDLSTWQTNSHILLYNTHPLASKHTFRAMAYITIMKYNTQGNYKLWWPSDISTMTEWILHGNVIMKCQNIDTSRLSLHYSYKSYKNTIQRWQMKGKINPCWLGWTRPILSLPKNNIHTQNTGLP